MNSQPTPLAHTRDRTPQAHTHNDTHSHTPDARRQTPQAQRREPVPDQTPLRAERAETRHRVRVDTLAI